MSRTAIDTTSTAGRSMLVVLAGARARTMSRTPVREFCFLYRRRIRAIAEFDKRFDFPFLVGTQWEVRESAMLFSVFPASRMV